MRLIRRRAADAPAMRTELFLCERGDRAASHFSLPDCAFFCALPKILCRQSLLNTRVLWAR